MYLRATERRKTESSRNKTCFCVIACICTRSGTSFNMIVAKKDAFCVIACIVRATYCLKTKSSRNNKKTITSLGPIRPNCKSKPSQKDGTLNRWDRYYGTTNQDDPIGPTRSFRPIISIGPTRSYIPIRSLLPTRSSKSSKRSDGYLTIIERLYSLESTTRSDGYLTIIERLYSSKSSTRWDGYLTVIERLYSLKSMQDRTVVRRLRSSHRTIPVITRLDGPTRFQ